MIVLVNSKSCELDSRIVETSNLLKEVGESDDDSPFPINLDLSLELSEYFKGNLFTEFLNEGESKKYSEKEIKEKFFLAEYLDCDYLAIDIYFDLGQLFSSGGKAARGMSIITFLHSLMKEKCKTKQIILDLLYFQKIKDCRIAYKLESDDSSDSDDYDEYDDYNYRDDYEGNHRNPRRRCYGRDSFQSMQAENKDLLESIEEVLPSFLEEITLSREKMFLSYVIGIGDPCESFACGLVYHLLKCKGENFTDGEILLILRKLTKNNFYFSKSCLFQLTYFPTQNSEILSIQKEICKIQFGNCITLEDKIRKIIVMYNRYSPSTKHGFVRYFCHLQDIALEEGLSLFEKNYPKHKWMI